MLTFLISILCISLSSCEDDQEGVDSALIGRSWTGDVGLGADNGEAIFSTFTFGADGFGEEYQYYEIDGKPYDRFRFQWYWEDDYSKNLVLDYGKNGISYMDNVRISGDEMRGTFFFTDDSRGFDFILYME